jgi:hypothetical protein
MDDPSFPLNFLLLARPPVANAAFPRWDRQGRGSSTLLMKGGKKIIKTADLDAISSFQS